MIRIGILGYGNLAKALEKQIDANNKMQLIAIFSRRAIQNSILGYPIYSREELDRFKGKIDMLILCTGSQSDLSNDALLYSQKFCTINTFDTHSNIYSLYKNLDEICKKNNTFSILSTGWDPGLFSIEKCIFQSILNKPSSSFWGKGVSLGHSQAVRQLDGVADAISFTIPHKKDIKKAYKGKATNNEHLRKVYVVSNNKKHNIKIDKQIKNLPHYFKGQNTIVKFVSKTRLGFLKTQKHKGNLICATKKDKLWLKVDMKSNANFTAKVVIMYIQAFKRLTKKYPSGAYTPLHFSPLDTSIFGKEMSIKKFC